MTCNELLAHALLLEQFGPQLGRPRVDTLKGSRHANMKELRFDAAGGVWRVAFAFDPKRKAVLWSRETSRAAAGRDFTVGSSQRLTKDLMSTCHERRTGKRKKGT